MSNRDKLNEIGIGLTTALINALHANLKWMEFKATLDREGRDATDEELAELRAANHALIEKILNR